MKKVLRTADIILIGIILVLFAAIIIFKPFASGASYVEVKTPDGTYIYPLSENATYRFKGNIGTSVVEIRDGAVYFLDSPCPNKTCMAEGGISEPGAFNACLPNGISITITGDKEVDDVSI